jgi:hypothetical protein
MPWLFTACPEPREIWTSGWTLIRATRIVSGARPRVRRPGTRNGSEEAGFHHVRHRRPDRTASTKDRLAHGNQRGFVRGSLGEPDRSSVRGARGSIHRARTLRPQQTGVRATEGPGRSGHAGKASISILILRGCAKPDSVDIAEVTMASSQCGTFTSMPPSTIEPGTRRPPALVIPVGISRRRVSPRRRAWDRRSPGGRSERSRWSAFSRA